MLRNDYGNATDDIHTNTLSGDYTILRVNKSTNPK